MSFATLNSFGGYHDDFYQYRNANLCPAETPALETEGFPQLSITDTGWTDEERNAMREHGYDSMDMLRVWLD